MKFLDFDIPESSVEEFEALLNQSGNVKRGVLVSGIVTSVKNGFVHVDVGLKSEGRIPIDEFYVDGKIGVPELYSQITVWLENLEDKNGKVVLSYSKALREESWEKLEGYYRQRKTVNGTVIRKVTGGCIINLAGASAFLPKSHVPGTVKDMRELVSKQYPCLIIKMDRARSNIVVSCRALNEGDQSIGLAEGQVVKGIVKNITDSSAFVDLGGITGRLHLSEISWNKIKDPSDVLKVGEEIDVKIIAMSPPNRVALSMKQLGEDPWLKTAEAAGIEEGKLFDVTVKSIDERGLFVAFDNSLEARVRVFDLAWMKRYQNSSLFKEGKKLNVKIVEIDKKRHKIYASVKHATSNPVEDFSKKHKVGDSLECKIVQLSDLGYVAQIEEGLDGVIPQIDMYVSGTLKLGTKLKVYVWNIHVENGHIVLGAKQPPL